LKTPNKHD
jgi:hypothetical protein